MLFARFNCAWASCASLKNKPMIEELEREFIPLQQKVKDLREYL